MSRIQAAFERLKKERRPAFIPYVMAGDPDLSTTRKIVLELARQGADLVELGVPSLDPLADGPVIQRAPRGPWNRGRPSPGSSASFETFAGRPRSRSS